MGMKERARREAQRAALAQVVRAAGGAAGAARIPDGSARGGGEVDADRHGSGARQGDRECEGGRAAVTFLRAYITDVDSCVLIVVLDRPRPRPLGDGRVGGIAQVDG